MARYDQLSIQLLPMFAGGTIAANRLVKMNGTTVDSVIATAAIADLAIGVVGPPASSGDQVGVQIGGVAKLTAKSAISVGDEVMPDSSGAGKIATASGPTARSIGIALEAATADGDIITVLLGCPALKGPANS